MCTMSDPPLMLYNASDLTTNSFASFMLMGKVHRPSSLLSTTKRFGFEKLNLKTNKNVFCFPPTPEICPCSQIQKMQVKRTLPSMMTMTMLKSKSSKCSDRLGCLTKLFPPAPFPKKHWKFVDFNHDTRITHLILIHVILQDVPRQTGFPEEAAAAFARR